MSWFQPKSGGWGTARLIMLLNTTLPHCQDGGRRAFPTGEWHGRGGLVSICLHFTCELFLCLILFVINIFAVMVNFLISFLFPVNCSYFNVWFAAFVPPVLNSVFRAGRGRAGGRKELVRASGLGECQWGHWIGKC